LGIRDPDSGPRCRPLEVLPAAGGRGVIVVLDRVVVAELALPLLRHQPENADVRVGHDRPPGPGNVIAMAVA
jgi:hypothetical protein